MKINYAILGSTTNPLYLDFWPIVSKVWKEVFKITPVLGLISNDKNDTIIDENGIIITLNKIEGFDDGFLSQISRLYLPKYLGGNCIISDIDMIPLSKKYFVDDLEKYNEDDFIVLSSHHPQTRNLNQYPMCYNVGNSKTFQKIFDLNQTWENFVKSSNYQGWYTDQIFLYNKIKLNNDVNFEFPIREGGFVQNRIDRINWNYIEEKVISDYYIDCHSLRPYSMYKKEIDKLINLLYS